MSHLLQVIVVYDFMQCLHLCFLSVGIGQCAISSNFMSSIGLGTNNRFFGFGGVVNEGLPRFLHLFFPDINSACATSDLNFNRLVCFLHLVAYNVSYILAMHSLHTYLLDGKLFVNKSA